MPDESSPEALPAAIDSRVAMAAVLENTPVLTALLDRDFTFIWANRAYATACGRTPQFFAGKNHFDLYPNEENETIFRKVVDSGLPAYVESKSFRYPDQPDLGLTHWDWSVVPLLDPDGHVTQLVFTLMDVTERTRSKVSADLISRLHQSSAELTRNQVLVDALDGICELLESPIGFFHSVDSDEATVEMQVWSTKTREHFCTTQRAFNHCGLDQAGVWADCLRQRQAVIHNDFDSLTHKRGMPKGHARVTRELVVPIFRGERIVAILGIGNRPREYGEPDVATVSHAAGAAWEIADRIKASDELAVSEDRYRRSIELFPEPVYMNRDGRFVYVNSACVQLLGARDAQELIGTPIMDRVAPARRERARRRIGTLLERRGNAPLEETVFVRMDGSPVDVEVTATVFDAVDGPLIEVVLRDITERKRALRAIRESQERYKVLVEQSPSAIFINRNNKIDLVNHACVELFQAATPDELLGRSIFDLFHPEDREIVAERAKRIRFSGAPLPAVPERIVRLDGECRHVELSAAPFKEGDETLIHVVLRDTTEMRKADLEIRRHQQKLAELASELIQTGERERHRLAIELHDGIGQALAAAKMSARSLADESQSGASPEAVRLLGLLDHSIGHVRSMTAQLSPPALYELGLEPALERLVDDMLDLFGLECSFTPSATPCSLRDEAAAILFRAARELLSNVHRHAGVGIARLTVLEDHGTVILRVEDEGCGFDTGIIETGSTGRFGLFSLIQEVRQAGGTIVMQSSEGSGTTVEISVPAQRQS